MADDTMVPTTTLTPITGNLVAFHSYRDGDPEIFVKNADRNGVYPTGQKNYSSTWGG